MMGCQEGEGATGQKKVPDESQSDVSVCGIWKWGTSTLVDMQIVNLDAGYYLHQMSAKALATEEKYKKDKFLNPCLEHIIYFTPIVYSVDGIPGMEAVASQRCLALLLSNKMKQEYSGICGFVWARMSLAIVRSNTLLLRGARDKDVCFRQRPDLEDGAVMKHLAPWRG